MFGPPNSLFCCLARHYDHRPDTASAIGGPRPLLRVSLQVLLDGLAADLRGQPEIAAADFRFEWR
jgi:hypothetical protein